MRSQRKTPATSCVTGVLWIWFQVLKPKPWDKGLHQKTPFHKVSDNKKETDKVSFKTTALVMDHGPSDALSKLLLMALADRSNESGVCWPSRDDLLKRTGVSYATVSRKLRMLEVQGWIQRKRQFNSATVFRLNLQRLSRLETEANAAKLVSVPKGFEPFEDEIANLQAIENKGTVHSEPTSVHSEPTSVHSEPLTYQKPINNHRLRRASSNSFEKKSAASVSLDPQAIALKGEWLKASTGKTFADWKAEQAEKVGAL